MKKAVLKLRKNSGAHIAAAVLGGFAVFLLLLNIVSVDGTTQSIFLVGFRRFLYFMENGWVFAAFAEIASWVLRLLFLISLIAAPILAKKSFLVSVVPCGILAVCCIWRILFGSLWSEEAGAFLLLFFIAVALGLPLLLMGLGAVKTKTAAIVVSSVLLGFFTLLTLGEGLPFVLYLDNGRYEIVNLSGFFAFQLECIAILVLAAGTESPAEYAARLQAETVGNGFAPMGNRGQFFCGYQHKGQSLCGVWTKSLFGRLCAARAADGSVFSACSCERPPYIRFAQGVKRFCSRAADSRAHESKRFHARQAYGGSLRGDACCRRR